MIRLSVPVRLMGRTAHLMTVGPGVTGTPRLPSARCSQCPHNPFARFSGERLKARPTVAKVSREALHSAGLLLRLFADHLELIGDRLLSAAGKWEGKCLRNLERILADCYKNKVTLPEVALKVGMCPEHLSRMFHRKTGRTISRHLMELRVAEFKRLLMSPDENVTTAIFDSGFHSISQGNRAFRKICGMSPRQFRDGILRLTRR